jgi:hypothetical protein
MWMQVRSKLKVMFLSEKAEKMTARTEQDSAAISSSGTNRKENPAQDRPDRQQGVRLARPTTDQVARHTKIQVAKQKTFGSQAEDGQDVRQNRRIWTPGRGQMESPGRGTDRLLGAVEDR